LEEVQPAGKAAATGAVAGEAIYTSESTDGAARRLAGSGQQQQQQQQQEVAAHMDHERGLKQGWQWPNLPDFPAGPPEDGDAAPAVFTAIAATEDYTVEESLDGVTPGKIPASPPPKTVKGNPTVKVVNAIAADTTTSKATAPAPKTVVVTALAASATPKVTTKASASSTGTVRVTALGDWSLPNFPPTPATPKGAKVAVVTKAASTKKSSPPPPPPPPPPLVEMPPMGNEQRY
jgi:hypothetical protein